MSDHSNPYKTPEAVIAPPLGGDSGAVFNGNLLVVPNGGKTLQVDHITREHMYFKGVAKNLLDPR